jgi:hypothetical protein
MLSLAIIALLLSQTPLFRRAQAAVSRGH